MNLLCLILRPILISTIYVLFGTGLLFAVELDDSALFVEAFNAGKKKDYLLVIEKVEQLHQLFPETPLRDVSLLMLARAALRSGDNALAARTINRFTAEFSDSVLLESIEDELIVLGNRRKNGEELAPSLSLQAAARAVRDEHQANEKIISIGTVQKKLTTEKAEAERQLKVKIAADKAARDSIKLTISLPEPDKSFEVDRRGRLFFELANNGNSREEFQLKTTASPEYAVRFSSADDDMVSIERVSVSAGKKFKGVISFQMPHDRIDGFKMTLPIKAVSGRFTDVSFSRDVIITASAPLIRAVAKPNKAKAYSGEPFQYRITLINTGSLAARKLAVRIELPGQLEFVESKKAGYAIESDRVAVYGVETLLSGGLKEVVLHVKVKDSIEDKSDLHCQIEVTNEQLKHKSYFSSIPVSVVRH